MEYNESFTSFVLHHPRSLNSHLSLHSELSNTANKNTSEAISAFQLVKDYSQFLRATNSFVFYLLLSLWIHATLNKVMVVLTGICACLMSCLMNHRWKDLRTIQLGGGRPPRMGRTYCPLWCCSQQQRGS